MSAHTRGPWAQHPAYPWIIKQDLSPIADAAEGVTIGNTTGLDNSGFFPSGDEGRANARLIACAPELLAELDRQIEREHNPFEPENQSAAYHRMVALRVKATGSAS